MPAALTVRLTRISPTHHRLSYTRPDGSGETIELESRSCLYHDLVHFAVETEAGLMKSFYGHLASATSYAEFAALDTTFKDEIRITEAVVGVIQGALRTEVETGRALEGVKMMLEMQTLPRPEWITPEFIERVKERMRRLVGEWNHTPFGKTMTLVFQLDHMSEPGPAAP